MTIFDATTFAVRPARLNARPFEERDQMGSRGHYPNAHLYLETQNSVYTFDVEGGSWETRFTLGYTSNEEMKKYEGLHVDLGRKGTVKDLITKILYGHCPFERLDLLQQLVGRPYSFSVLDWKGMYGCDSTIRFTWDVTRVKRVELREGLSRR